MLKAPIKMINGGLKCPTKGTPQGGIISPLLANIVFNELDHWVESNWEENPIVYKYSHQKNAKGKEIKSSGYRVMRSANLKEMYIVRYADDFRIFCRTKTAAEKTKITVTQWLAERLKLEVSPEKTRVVNVKCRYSEFLGFKIKFHTKGSQKVVKSHISNKNFNSQRKALVKQVKRIARPRAKFGRLGEIWQYNAIVRGMQNYYRIAMEVNFGCHKLNRAVIIIITNRLLGISKTGRKLTKAEKERYGKSEMLRYLSKEPIYPAGYVQHKIPTSKKFGISYEFDTRAILITRQLIYNQNLEYLDNRVSLYFAQKGKCAVTGEKFTIVDDIHCHHKILKWH